MQGKQNQYNFFQNYNMCRPSDNLFGTKKKNFKKMKKIRPTIAIPRKYSLIIYKVMIKR